MNNKRLMYRGSRKHVLDWVEQDDFPYQLKELIALPGVVIDRDDVWHPIGYQKPDEARLEKFGPREFPHLVSSASLKGWWLAHNGRANTPNWDLVSTCTIADQKGLVLVEAKAHANELSTAGKLLKPDASEKSSENHEHIGKAIKEADGELGRYIPGLNLSRDTHYQLANRAAWAWKVTSLGVPVVLIYLAFLDDQGIADVGEPIRDDGHWISLMKDYTRGILPESFFNRWLPCHEAAMQIILRSKTIIERSPPRYSMA
jgi:hypothetical protein